MAAAQEVVLPEKVDELLDAICREKSKPPADVVARRYLSEIGEKESLSILDIIFKSTKVTNLSAFIVHMVKLKSRSSLSPRSPIVVPSTNSPQQQGDTSSANKRMKSSDCTARRVCIFDSPPKVEEKIDLPKDNSVLEALEKLEFRKAFLILNYIGCSKLEDYVSAAQIQSYHGLRMWEFETQIWNDFGRENCQEKERIKLPDGATGERYYYHCHVNANGTCRFKGPYLNKAATLLQKTVGDENVLIVKFMELGAETMSADSKMQCPVFNEVAEEGIFVGSKRYRFFVFKDGGKEEKKKDPTSSPVKCYFVCMEGFASLLEKPPHLVKDMSVQDARGLFMHIHKATSLSNYMARFSLILSKTITLELNFDDLHVEVIDDEPCRDEDGNIVNDRDGKAMILTDGTGFISEDLALKCPHDCYNGFVNSEENIQVLEGSLEGFQNSNISGLSKLKSLPAPGVPPLLIQFRMFHKGRAIKGTVLVNRKLPPNTIVVRRSMLKIDFDENLSGAPTVNSFEVVATSNKPKVASLSKNLIALLHYGGVPSSVFLVMLRDALSKPLAPLYRTKAALRVAVNWDFTNEYIVTRMVASGIPLDEPYLQHRLAEIAKEEMKCLKVGRLLVDDSYYVMGTADPTQTLNSGEVCIILDQGQLSGPVLVYRNPGTHPGDIHVLNARYVEALKDFVGSSKYGIFFPSKGARSTGDEIAGGDYDGDTYWVSTNSELLKYFKPSEPWNCGTCAMNANKQTSLPPAAALETKLFRLYLTTSFQPSKAMGKAADSWLVYMDRMLTLGDDCADEKATLRQKIDQLIDIYYDALDAPKKGKKVEVPKGLIPDRYPHHMERGEHCTYKSKSILGEIYDIVDQYSAEIKFWKLEYFEAEIPEDHLVSWGKLYDEYRKDMSSALGGSRSPAAVYEKYRKKLYGGVGELDMREKVWEEIRLEALAIYHICYDYAKELGDLKKCGFAWKVAGDALWKIVLERKGEKPILFAPSVICQMTR